MYQGTESLILEDVRRLGNHIYAYVIEPGRANDYRARVIIQVHPAHYEDGPISVRVESTVGDTLRCMRFLSENPEVVRTVIANTMEEGWHE
jgi:hypothetical protein